MLVVAVIVVVTVYGGLGRGLVGEGGVGRVGVVVCGRHRHFVSMSVLSALERKRKGEGGGG